MENSKAELIPEGKMRQLDIKNKALNPLFKAYVF